MRLSNDALDLFEPGRAENFFEIDDLPDFDPGRTVAFSRRNALWLAEFARLIYRQGADEIQGRANGRTRAHLLDARGWRETAFINRNGTQSALLENAALGCACLVFRGTLGLRDLQTDSRFLAVRWQGAGNVHRGFKTALSNVWAWIEEKLRAVEVPVFFTGHSLGGALATLAAARIALDPQFDTPAAVYSFGSPRVGDAKFGGVFERLFHCRCVNDQDLVTTVPPAFSVPGFPVYQHTGEMHRLLPDGVMEIYPPGFDVRTTRNAAAGLIDFTRNISRLLEQAIPGGPIAGPLMDHAPVNYVARLEGVAPTPR